jgi:hypothetical protein
MTTADSGSKAQLDERSDLRKELQFLKECQFKYFSLAVTISGLIVGVADKFNTSTQDDRGVLLAPLLVVLPCWYIFFDKATTITRMVAYLVVLERIISGDNTYRFLGWENAIFKYRDLASEIKGWDRVKHYWKGIASGVAALAPLRSVNRYWMLCWLTFAGLSAASLWLGLSSSSTPLYAFSAVLSAGIAISTLLLLMQLVGGNASYKANVNKWEKYLSTDLHSNDG